MIITSASLNSTGTAVYLMDPETLAERRLVARDVARRLGWNVEDFREQFGNRNSFDLDYDKVSDLPNFKS